MEEMPYPLLKDFVFKQVFGNPRKTASLALLLKQVLPLRDEELGRLKIEKTFIERSHREDKLVVLDIRASTAKGQAFDVELQVQKTPVFPDRLAFYLGKLAGGQLRPGEKYDKLRLRPVYCVAVCNFAVLPGLPGYIHRFSLREDECGAQFTKMMNIITIALPKMPKENDGSRMWPVLECFRCKTVEEAEMHAKSYPAIGKIVAELREFSLSRKFRYTWEQREKAWRDRKMLEDEFRSQGLQAGMQEGIQKGMQAGMREGIQKGIQEGMQEGIQKGIQEGAAREREKWEALMSEKDAELERLRRIAGEASGGSGGIC
jgi:predicted transposase/invertase (TIGR01784 family)